MCAKCHMYYTIHNVRELRKALKRYEPSDRLDVLKTWLEREYFTNLIYLEYLSANRL